MPKKTKGNPQITWTSSEPSDYECALDNLDNRVRCGGGTSGQWIGVDIPKGPHTFWVRGTDSTKNVGDWKFYTFDVGKDAALAYSRTDLSLRGFCTVLTIPYLLYGTSWGTSSF